MPKFIKIKVSAWQDNNDDILLHHRRSFIPGPNQIGGEDSPTECRKTERRMTEHRMIERRKTQHRMNERQIYPTSNRTQRRLGHVKRLCIESTQRRMELNF
jgi:hypothetical protein